MTTLSKVIIGTHLIACRECGGEWQRGLPERHDPTCPQFETYSVFIEYDGCINNGALFTGTRDECRYWIRDNYFRLKRIHKFRRHFADGPAIKNNATGRLISFVIPD